MMGVISEFKSFTLTMRVNTLLGESQKIAASIGDLPVFLFPQLRNRMIDLDEEAYELATELYKLYIAGDEFERAKEMLEAEKVIEMALFQLKKYDGFRTYYL